MSEYKGFWIDTYEEQPQRWFAKIRRMDGQKFWNPIMKVERHYSETPSARRTERGAIELAKEMIDGLGHA